MNHSQDHLHGPSAFAVPDWALSALAALFFLGACFFIGRLLRPTAVRRRLGHWDWENEVGHASCMLAMAVMLTPSTFFQGHETAWSVALGFGAAWFGVRSMTWGRSIPGNRVWADLVHSGMLLGMALMFRPPAPSVIFLGVQVAFWAWFALYYVRQSFRDTRGHAPLRLGSNLAHLAMGAVMVPMTLFPAALMPGHRAGSQGRAVVGRDATPDPKPLATSDGPARLLDDGDFSAEVFASSDPVAILVFGGCEKCAEEVCLFDALAREYVGSPLKFVRVNKDDSPRSCETLGVKDCPRVCIVSPRGIAISDEGTDVTDGAQLRLFIAAHLE
jgi:hypothetical protein